uniref:inorganic diphosphatase n=1 Tax=Cacopsylla melanoneura TaxID=428564 RepID=A0A8D8YWJ6_9HEMI
MGPIYLALFLASIVCILNAHDHYRRSKRAIKNITHRPMTKIEPVEKGVFNTKHYRMFFKNEHGLISPYHDIPLFANLANKTFNMIVEVPRWTNEKMEISLDEVFNPIRHRIKNHTLEYIPDVHPHDGYFFNYGCFPGTWEDPEEIEGHTGLKGDGHLLDVMEIGEREAGRGEIMQVKALGVFAVEDDGRIDWKIIAVCVNDSNADKLNDIRDVEKVYPGFLEGVKIWFKEFKTANGKPNSKLAIEGRIFDKEFAHNVIERAWKQWMDMMLKESSEVATPNVALMNTCIPGHRAHVTYEMADKQLNRRTFPTGTPPPPRKIDPLDM